MQNDVPVQSVMSGEEKRSMQDKAVKSVDPTKVDKTIKEQRKSDKIDDCQRSPLRFARFAFMLS